VPIGASCIGGLAQTTEHEKTGLLVEPGNPRELAAALRRLIDDPALRHIFGETGRERVLQHYDWDRILDGYYIPLIEQALAHNSGEQKKKDFVNLQSEA
ncbi:MAG: glycosyltransferase, partial [Candidatus Hinthialibacter sp.]